MTQHSDWLYGHQSDYYYYDNIRSFKRPTSNSTFSAYAIISLILIYYILHILDLPLLSIPELLWNAMVRLTPSPLLARLDEEYRYNRGTVEENGDEAHAQNLARKSEAMRRIIGVEGPGMIQYLPRPRSLSNMLASTAEPGVQSLPGLGNWDNSCYQNSVIQGLAALPSLSAFLDRVTPAEALSTQSTSYALKTMIKRLNSPSNAGKRLWTPAVLKSMSSWQQQDAQEYFSKIFDEVEKESAKLPVKPVQNAKLGILKNLNNTSEKQNKGSGETLACASTASSQSLDLQSLHNLPSELQSTLLRNPLSGLLAQRVGCLQCGYVEGLSLIPFNCLTLPLGPLPLYDIRTCLDAYTTLEHISEIECPKCTLLRHQAQLCKILHELNSDTGDDRGGNMVRERVKESMRTRLGAVNQALEDEDFADATLLKKCQIPAKSRVLVTKSKQAVVARMPKALVMHVNRSNFDEMTGMQSKNYASVRFPPTLDLSSWCLGGAGAAGTFDDGKGMETWEINPARSMLKSGEGGGATYSLKAVITHRGRHENGHYICYRKSRFEGQEDENWWRLSDDTVTRQSEDDVLAEGGVFMIFYELENAPPPTATKAGEAYLPEKLATPASGVSAPSTAQHDPPAPEIASPQDEPLLSTLTPATEPELAAPATLPPILPIPPPAADDPSPIAPIALSTSDPSSVPELPSSFEPSTENAEQPPSTPPEPMPDVAVPDAVLPPPLWDSSQHLAPRMRTASLRSNRGSIGKAGRGTANVSSMVTAN